MTHTPGPWRIERQRAPNGGTYYRIYDQDDMRAVIAQIVGDGRFEYHENARLIAAAPELLAALKGLLHEPMSERAVDAAKRALAYAEKGA